jgi:hypothetical protein
MIAGTIGLEKGNSNIHDTHVFLAGLGMHFLTNFNISRLSSLNKISGNCLYSNQCVHDNKKINKINK